MELTVIEQLGTALVAVLVWAIGLGTVYVVRHVKHEYAQGAIGRLSDLARLVVREVWQTMVETAKDNDSGRLDKSIAIAAKQAAMGKLKTYLGPRGIKAIMYVAGISNPADLEEYLGGAIESAIVAEKNDSRIKSHVNVSYAPAGKEEFVGLA